MGRNDGEIDHSLVIAEGVAQALLLEMPTQPTPPIEPPESIFTRFAQWLRQLFFFAPRRHLAMILGQRSAESLGDNSIRDALRLPIKKKHVMVCSCAN